mmetsp:Transcript_20215/g.36539  ORF Transcript_20215/g.36539 Transcript_20215/m.36539 type:complete len:348 (-) Transcript_20215:209-1252(-)|eukprot:CAMPEP_0201884422 /NCGR_PEP_ID=MMETSP0902-20130614/17144_1 /ASSEMBLY_ACC=CAM_ASM_000551 /TAXON_ID=420261 /ORGANISM="Thalassiosira antarctica, Strain CCMP982" /LENGTH=347 /DNA_ID=CAMNT_0048413385 /DNA_START=28 /DNA_END=1071 /DNA_ORIENTATION=+
MDNNEGKPPPAVKLDGFAPAAGSGATGSSSLTTAVSASASAGVASAASAAAAAAGGGAGAGTASIAAPSAKKPATAKRAYKKKPKKGAAASAASSENSNDNDTEETVLRPLSDVGSNFSPLSLPQIQLRLKSLLDTLPKDLPEIPPAYNVNDAVAIHALQHAPIKSFASTLQVTIEEYNLLLSLVSCATYRWGVDRSGASQQNLSVVSAELQQCQDVISNVVSARLSNVLCPAVDVMIGEVEIVRDGENGEETPIKTPAKKRKLNKDKLSTATSSRTNNNERRINHWARPLVDPSYVHLCHCILARNAPLIRHTVATSIYTAQKVIGDYLNAMKKDSSHEPGKGGYY